MKKAPHMLFGVGARVAAANELLERWGDTHEVPPSQRGNPGTCSYSEW